MKKTIAVALTLLVMVTMMTACTKRIARGTTNMEEGTYINESIDLKFTKPKNWIFLSQEEIAQQMQITAEMLQDEDILMNEKVAQLIEFSAINPKTNDNVSLIIERGRGSVDKYVEAFKKQVQGEVNSPITYTFDDEIPEVKLSGKDYKRLTSTGTDKYGRKIKQYSYVSKVGNFFIVIIATVSPDNIATYGPSFFELCFTSTKL